MDITDIKILNILKKNSRTPIKDISSAVNLSAPATKERINKMIASGLIREFTTILEPHVLGKTLTAFMFLTLRNAGLNDNFREMVKGEPDVLSCYYLTGDFDYMIQIVTKDTDSLEHLISRLRNSQEFLRTKTIVALSTVKEKHSVFP